ncbi:fimbrial protein [Serratia fonticola]|uniref:fimbrial protein n=1 Tax=Serratia fonticola TaxID=47917 RepID=UPI0035A6AD83
MPLQATNITVGPDTSNGTVIYRQTYNPGSSYNATTRCTPNGQFILERKVTRTPYPLSTWNGTPYPGKVYNTNIPGIGAAVWNAGTAFPFTVNVCGATTVCIYGTNYFTFDISLIKIGPITPGTLTGTALPCISHYVGTAGSTVPAVSACYSGAINIVSQTCTTPDVSVNLGSYDIKEFTGVNSTSKWIDSSIKLIDCPVFYGTYPDTGSNTYVYWSENGNSNLGTPKNNTISILLLPSSSVINAANGIMGIDTALPDAASGIGIQIASGTAASQTLFDLNSRTQKTMFSNQGRNVDIPLVARFIQTSSLVKPGKANGRVTFVINYY